jgi:hypothetical protein
MQEWVEAETEWEVPSIAALNVSGLMFHNRRMK